ncbi:MAG: nucleoside triphosphate pyrophosphohydrolase [Gammaproteobacteria bacterium]|nr:nucleoside triphosphate pyrophosphohydrolase [Gammaproteobacteria bacterium]
MSEDQPRGQQESQPGESHAQPQPAIATLLGIMRQLRDPNTGCAWDREQTLQSIIPHTLEEAHELAEAVAQGEPAAIRDELGDLLFQVVFLARIAEERGWFDFDSVAAAIGEKLVRRHPHVFAVQTALNAGQQTAAWEALKREERQNRGESGVLAGVARTLPALTRSAKLGKRARGVGFDWPDARGIRDKVDEEFAEFEATLAEGESHERQTEELGDLLFTIANWGRLLGLDPEAALRATNAKFERRFGHIEANVATQGLTLEGLSAEQWEALWQQAKAAERGKAG